MRPESGETQLTFSQELASYPSEVLTSFMTPPPTGVREFSAYILRDTPGIALLGCLLVGGAHALDTVNTALSVDYRIAAAEYLGLTASILPLSVLSRRVTRPLTQRIDRFINPT